MSSRVMLYACALATGVAVIGAVVQRAAGLVERPDFGPPPEHVLRRRAEFERRRAEAAEGRTQSHN